MLGWLSEHVWWEPSREAAFRYSYWRARRWRLNDDAAKCIAGDAVCDAAIIAASKKAETQFPAMSAFLVWFRQTAGSYVTKELKERNRLKEGIDSVSCEAKREDLG